MSQYELKEFTGTMGGETHKSSGMRIKPITGLVLVFMAMLIAVGVGLIVHFAENRKLECTLPETNVVNGGGSNSKQQQGQGSVIISTRKQIDASTAAPIPATQIPSRDIRLPQTIKPYHYVLKLKPNMYSGDPSQFTFEGSVTIMMGAIQPSRTITLHAKDLNINNSTLRLSSMSGSAPRITSYTVYKSLDFLDLHLDGEISPGQNYSLVMDFTGPLKDDLHGLYYSSYTQGDKTVYLATTQFETLHARKAFPCFDEPAMKATFQVTLVRKKNLLSLSNMQITNNRTVADDFVEDVYDITPKMSTYLLAFIVGDFKHKQRMVPNSNVTYGAWSRPELVSQTQLALDVGAQTTKIYNDFFQIPFPLPKQDMIALPDFRAGAMENWGLVTYRESYMLYDDAVSSASQKQSTVMVVTHELAHQWFGNLVTMQWWDDTWLNEGFARFMQYLSADKLYPEWKLFDQFVPSQLQLVLETDSYVTSHPLSSHADTADEIGDMFNGISYRKGGSIIRMVRFIMGEESFRKGLTRYLNAHKYENTVHDDLWRALTEQAVSEGKNLDITELMAPWTLQMNYPVVKVVKHSGHLLVSQERFLMNPDAKNPGKYTSSYGYRWPIPFTYTTESNPNFNVTDKDITWISTDSKDIEVPTLQPSDWVIANIQEYGYYRVNYEDSNWLALIKVLNTNHKIIPAINRAQLINDAWSLSRAGKLSTAIALRTLEYLHNEQDYVPWYAARSQIQYLDRMLRGTENYGKLKEFLLDKLRMPYKQYGMSNVNITHIDGLTQNLVAEMACSYGLAECVQSSQKMYDDWMSNPGVNSIDPNIQYTVYCTAIAEGNDEHWEFALQQLQKSQVATIRARLMAALACTRSTWLIRRYLQLSITPSIIRKQDAASVMSGIASSSTGQLFVWEFIRERWQSLNEYSGDAIPFSAIFSELASSFNTRFQLDQLKSFKDAHSELGRATTAYNSAVEEITSNINWIKNNLMTVTDWLDKAAKSSNSRVTDVRLPRHLIPNMYDVTLQPNMYSGNPETFTFDGHVKIYMTAKTAGSNVTLHVNKLNISDNTVRFARENGEPSPSYIAGSMKTDTERQFGIFFLDSSVIQGNNYTIELNFTAKLTNDLHGLYYSQYDRANETIYIATTQFESTDARRAFPCFDEPDIKAVFNTRLIRKSSMKSLSNMPIKQEVNMADDLVMDVYQRSQKMSTYLLAFIVCDFDYTASKTKSNITYKAWARPESKNQTAVALETGVKVIEHYEDYFGIGFPLPKQEMIAIPDFASGAMENWGLITYRETAMLYDPTDSSEGNKQRVKVVVAHELAHQWFGDLVTMKWWDDLWLNEGFASFVEYMGVDFVSPEWKMFEQFAFELQEVFEVDSLKTSHPIFVPVKNPVEIREIFDSISYAKGACVIRMMRFFLGESTFQKGLQIYLKNRKYDNADHDDLWAGLQEQAGTENKNINVSEVMDTWIKQMNYPVVKVTKADNGHISISQQRFLSNTETKDPGRYASPYGYMWKIPFTFTTKKHATFNQTDENVHWLTTKQQEINETYPEIGDWIIGNIQQYGVYRVNYDEENWKLLVKQLKENHTRIGVINRAQIINDAFGLAKAKQLSMDIALSTLDYLDKEEAYVPWATGASELSYIGHMLADTELYGNFQRLMKKKVEHQFNRLGLNDTGTEHLDSYLRTTISSRACSNGNEECVNKAKDLFNQYKKNPKNNPISPNLRSVIYCTAIREGEEAEWQFISDQYKAATVPGEKSRLLSALTCTRQIWIINKLLHSSLDESFVRKQDSYSLYGYISQDPVGRCVAWDFFRANFQKIFDTYGNGAFSMTRIVKGIASTFNTEFQLQQLKDFKKEHPNLGTGTRALDQAIEQTQSNIKWMKDYYDIVEKWLEPFSKFA